MQLEENSHSSTGADCKYLTGAGIGYSSDVEESGKRAIATMGAKDLFGKEAQKLPLNNTPFMFELAKADGDRISSSLSKAGHLPRSSRSHVPQPHPFKAGFGPCKGNTRGESNHRYKKSGDSSVVRAQANARKGIPNWCSPVANSFISFQCGPNAVGFHPTMQQFCVPPISDVRPSLELNHCEVPYNIPTIGRFSSHGQPYGSHNLVDDPPGLHGWDENNGAIGSEAHTYGGMIGTIMED